MTFAEKLKLALEKSGMTRSELADKAGISRPMITNYLNGGYKAKQNNIFRLAKALNISETELIEDEYVSAPAPAANKTLYATHRIPVLGRVAAGTPIEACEDILDYVYMDKKYENDGYKYFALKIQGHSMEPTIMDGDTVIVRQQETIETGQIAIVLVDGEDATAKEVKEAPEGITLIGHNAAVYTPHFYSNEDIETLPLRVLGRVIEVRRDV